MTQKIRIGLSSFSNHHWQKIFYPEDLPRSAWFDYYCSHFDTYELNATFYKFPTIRILQNWYKKAPEGFLYAVKAPKVITHVKKFIDCREELESFYAICREGLADKLGCVLFQFPPSFAFEESKLELFLVSLDPEFKNVIEFRNSSWWRQEVLDAFAAQNIAFSGVSYPGLPDNFIATAPFGYMRFHGKEKLFYSDYDDEQLVDTFQQISDYPHLDEAFVYFNNTAGTAGVTDALRLMKIFETRKRAKIELPK